MDVRTVYVRTSKGEEEVRTREFHLRSVQRQALILVDGHSTLGALLDRWGSLSGLSEALESLAADGFIAPLSSTPAPATVAPPAGPTAPEDIRARLLALVDSMVPRNNAKLIARLQDAPLSHDGLQAAVDGCYKLIRLTIDERLAEQFAARARSLLQRI